MANGPNRRKLFFDWSVSSFFGWGVYGLNLMRVMADDPDFQPVTVARFYPERIVLDDADADRVVPLLETSVRFQDILRDYAGQDVKLRSPVLRALREQLTPLGAAENGVAITSDQMAGVVFFENANIDAAAIERGRAYQLIVAGSSWNSSVLTDRGLDNVATVVQGIDTRKFHPGAKTGLFGDRFAVFSGGKLERRKGQDLVLRAFKAFRQRHDDVVLMTAWHCPWGAQIAQDMARQAGIAAVPLLETGAVDVLGWAAANGLPAGSVVDLGPLPNAHLPMIYREMDAALFTNRCEGGTNLVAMEAMACGVPTILSANTGHLDLIAPDTCLPLTRQSDSGGDGSGWRDSDVDEIVERLETLYQDRNRGAEIGAAGARFMAGWDWQVRIAALKGHLLRAFA